jgi:hypothetical protein
MSWEAFRLTSKSPSELNDVLGPEGVDHLIRQALTACWNELPPGERSLAAWRRVAGELFERNMSVWRKIRKPDPAAFFADLSPRPADGHLRQALVLCWMMLPRAGGRDFKDVAKVATAIWDRDVATWEADNATFTKGPGKTVKRTETPKPAKRTKTAKKAPAKAKAKRSGLRR